MKRGYIGFLIFLFSVFMFYLLFPFFSKQANQLEYSVKLLSGFAVIAAVVVALAVADRKKESVEMSIEEPYIIDEEKEEYKEGELGGSVKACYKKFPVTSYRVHFKMKNISGFDLKNPVFTFNKLPIEKQRPYSETGNKSYSTRCFSFSIVRTDKKPHFLVVDGKYHLISIDGLPYWNNGSEIDHWIRMVLDSGGLEQFDVEVSVNCENADGQTQKVTIRPEELLKSKSNDL